MSLARPNVDAMSGYTPGKQPATGQRVVKLNTNENPFPPSPKVLEAIRGIDGETLRLYPSPDAAAFRHTAAEVLGVSPDMILAGNGSDDCLTILTRTFVGPNRTVASPWPTYSLYPVLTQIEDAGYERVPWLDGWRLPTKELLATKAQAIYLANPNAPSGTFVPIDELAELAERFKGVLLVDEAYADFAEENALRLVHEFENVVITRSLSKGYGLAGIRFGFAIAHASLIAQMAKVKDSYNVDAVAHAAAVAAIRDQDYARGTWQHVREERGRLILELQLLGFNVIPSQTNFLLAYHERAAELHEGLEKSGILVRRFSNEPSVADALRITVGTSQQNNAVVAALTDLLAAPATAEAGA